MSICLTASVNQGSIDNQYLFDLGHMGEIINRSVSFDVSCGIGAGLQYKADNSSFEVDQDKLWPMQ